jgi:hypothetical protein
MDRRARTGWLVCFIVVSLPLLLILLLGTWDLIGSLTSATPPSHDRSAYFADWKVYPWYWWPYLLMVPHKEFIVGVIIATYFLAAMAFWRMSQGKRGRSVFLAHVLTANIFCLAVAVSAIGMVVGGPARAYNGVMVSMSSDELVFLFGIAAFLDFPLLCAGITALILRLSRRRPSQRIRPDKTPGQVPPESTGGMRAQPHRAQRSQSERRI